MWNDKLYIDGIDAFLEWGAFVADGGYKQLIQYPSFKKLTYTEWEEYNGAEYDLSAPVLDAQSVQLDFFFTDVKFAEDMYFHLTQSAYHTFYFVDLARTYTLRLTGGNVPTNVKKMGKITLTFSIDFPTIPTQSFQSITPITNQGYTLDEVDFGNYAIHVLKGSDNEMMKLANVREAVNISMADTSGISYNTNAPVKMRTYDVTLKLLINAPTIAEFWLRYEAFFSDVLYSGARELYFQRWDNTFGCFYKSMSVSKFKLLTGGRVWCEFSVVMTITDFALNENWLILAAEDGDLIVTENGTYNIKIRKG